MAENKTTATTEMEDTAAAQESAAVDSEVRRVEEANKRLLRKQEKVRIIIPSGRGEHERAPVILGVNGREFLIVRDKEVEVPVGVVNVLNLAKEKTAVPRRDEKGQITVVWEEVPRIPFQVLGPAKKK